MASKIKVDNIENQCGGAVVTKCGATTTISGSVVKADDIQAADGGNLINQCGTTITLGASGDTINLASGASQSGFGRTGTVDWQTSIKTSGFTAVSGEGYFCNTTSGSFTVTLPASPSVGDIVAIKDYAQTFDTNKLTIGRNSEPIEGQTFDLDLSTEGAALTLVYGDATKGWQSVNSNEITNTTEFITATGGTITTVDTDYKVHTFTGPGTFTVTAGKGPLAVVDYMVIAGGGGAGPDHGGGGGAGGYRESHNSCTSGPYTASPLATPTSLPVSIQGYPITVGSGGTGGAATADCGARGNSSIFSTITSTGGGGIKLAPAPLTQGPMPGGSGSGAAGQGNSPGVGGSGNTPPVSPPQGNSGGNSQASTSSGGSGGGGAGGVGGNGGSPQRTAGSGGAGTTTSINGTPTVRVSGGSGGTSSPGSPQPATPGGGGAGGAGPVQGSPGTANTGGGGGGGSGNTPPFGGGNGGSGIVIIRYKFQ